MSLLNIQSLISVIPVKDFAAAMAFYQKWLGQPDEVPMEGMAEWQIAPQAWLQLDSSIPETAGSSAIILGVADIHQSREALLEAGIEAGPVQDYDFILVSDFHDPDGNRISLVQTTA